MTGIWSSQKSCHTLAVRPQPNTGAFSILSNLNEGVLHRDFDLNNADQTRSGNRIDKLMTIPSGNGATTRCSMIPSVLCYIFHNTWLSSLMLSGINYVANSRKSSRSTAMKIYCLYRLYLPQNWHVSMQKHDPQRAVITSLQSRQVPPSPFIPNLFGEFLFIRTYCTK